MAIRFQEDGEKENKIVEFIRQHPGVTTYDIYAKASINSKTGVQVLRELEKNNRIHVKRGVNGARYHYVR